MTSLERSPTTTKKLLFFSCKPLRMSAGILESLRQGLVNPRLYYRGAGGPYTAFRDILTVLCVDRCRL